MRYAICAETNFKNSNPSAYAVHSLYCDDKSTPLIRKDFVRDIFSKIMNKISYIEGKV